MKRREFLRQSLLASLAAGVTLSRPTRALGAECQLVDMPRTLVNVMLQGGADLRFLFMPSPGHFDNTYINLTWEARRSLYTEDYTNYTQMFENEYSPVIDPVSGLAFGIHKQAGWLKTQFEANNVAIVCNAYCSRNRRHDQSILNADAAVPNLSHLNFDRNGWGGRLVEHLGGGINSVELGEQVSTFNKGSIAGNRLQRVVHAQDMRDFALASPDEEGSATPRNIMARALRAYYDTRAQETALEKPANWPYHVFFQHNSALRAIGDQVQQSMDACMPLPDELVALELNSPEFAQQCRNLFDICQVPDELGLGVVSMGYGGWDSHDNEALEISANLQDIFSLDGGLASALAAIEDLPYMERPAREQLTFFFASDFGRQLVANGAQGTDHGRGTYSILMGSAVAGGVYGEMFPQRETLPDPDGEVPLQMPGADIEGRTSTERIIAQAVEWVKPGAADAVVPQAGLSGLEEGVDLGSLLSG